MARRALLGGRRAAAVEAMRNVNLRRLSLGWCSFYFVDSVALVGLSVWAYDDGGVDAVGVLGLFRLLPAALALPVGSWAADRFTRTRLVEWCFIAVAVLAAATAGCVATQAPASVVYVLVGLWGVAAAPYRPAHLALVPLAARSPEEVVGSNIASGMLEGLAAFAGPAVAGVLLIGGEPWLALAAAAVAGLGGVVALATLRVDVDPSLAVRRVPEPVLSSLAGGVVTLRRDPDLAVIVSAFVAQLLVRGVFSVLMVSVAFTLLDLGESGVGWLAAAIGIGGVAGACVAALRLSGRRLLGGPFATGLALWGLPIALTGVIPETAVVVAALVVLGLGNTVLDVAGFSILQRIADDRSLGRVFGVLYTAGTALAAVGALLAPVLEDAVGLRPLLVAVGALLPLLAVVALPVLRRIDRRSEPSAELLEVIGRIPMLVALPPTTLEKIAMRATLHDAVPGEVIVREGDDGNDFYAVATGEVDVSRADVVLSTLGPGASFGEIALVRECKRTATVTARGEVRLVTVPSQSFLDAISSSRPAWSMTWALTDELLAHDRTAAP